LITQAFYSPRDNPLPYLAGCFFTVKPGQVNGLKRGEFYTLPGIPLGGDVGKVMAYNIQSLLVGVYRALSYFNACKSRCHFLLLETVVKHYAS
jgi:hypothetical protein